MYKAMDVAHYIIKREYDKDRPVSNLQLQKLLYFIQGYFYACGEDGCFEDKIEAWDFGPVIPNVYREYKKYGSCIIMDVPKNYVCGISNNHRNMIDDVLDLCASKTNSELVAISQSQKPWEISHRFYIKEITPDRMKSFFCK